jgi:hypothetical protein
MDGLVPQRIDEARSVDRPGGQPATLLDGCEGWPTKRSCLLYLAAFLPFFTLPRNYVTHALLIAGTIWTPVLAASCRLRYVAWPKKLLFLRRRGFSVLYSSLSSEDG